MKHVLKMTEKEKNELETIEIEKRVGNNLKIKIGATNN